jgi:LCP family protein required for cell wall assembly
MLYSAFACLPPRRQGVSLTVNLPPRHPVLAAALSFLFPGLGQLYAGRRWRALLLAAPFLVVGSAVAAVSFAFASNFRNELFSSSFLLGILALDVALLAWRAFAIVDAGLGSWGPPAWLTAAGIGALLVVTVAMHAYLGVVVVSLNSTLGDVFGGGSATRGGTGGPPEGGGAPLNEPEYEWNGTERLNFLLLGVDAAPGREDALTDTILVVSVDPVARAAVMVSIPRDTGYMPLPDTSVYADGLYPRKINQLVSDATDDPALWCPDLDPAAAEACGIRTLQRTVGLYLGIGINYYAMVDLNGFTELIDAVGGVRICLDGRLSDPDYLDPSTGDRGITINAGCHTLDGRAALAYSRIRSGVIILADGTVETQDDFKRSARQQEVLLALRSALADADLIFELPGLLNAIGNTVTTDFPRSQAGDLASLLPLIAGPDIERLVLGLPDYVDPPIDPQRDYLLIPRRDAIRDAADELFAHEGPLQGWYVGSEAAGPTDEATPSP